MVQKLSIGEPFIETRLIREEEEYVTPGHCLLVNLDAEKSILVEEEFSLRPLSAMRTCGARIRVPGCALLICNVGTLDLSDLQTLDCLRKIWKNGSQGNRRGTPCYRSPQLVQDNLTARFVLVSEPDYPLGIHREHDGKRIREIHVQVVGDGAIDLLRSEDPDSRYATLPLTAGTAHTPTWNAEGIYPWHRYRSKSRCIFLVIKMEY